MCKFNYILSAIVLLVFLVLQLNTAFPQNQRAGKAKPVSQSGTQQNSYISMNASPAVYSDKNNKARFAYPLRDLVIAGDVAKAIYSDPILKRFDINFKVKNNVVYLSGKVGMDGAREYAEQVTSKVTGVQEVQNDIKYQDNSQPADNAYENDMAILEDVYSRYESNPIIDIEDVHVSVYNGTVRLSGVVNSYLEKELAASEALKTGARRVFNFLLVGEGPDTREIENSGDFYTWPY